MYRLVSSDSGFELYSSGPDGIDENGTNDDIVLIKGNNERIPNDTVE